MSRIVHVDLPRNITDADLALFKPFTDYQLNDLKTIFLEEAFVAYTGICVDATGVRKESHHDFGNKRDDFVNDAVVQFNEALSDPGKLIERDDDETYLIIHHPWASNYWHWITECILRVWMVRDETHKMTLILPDSLRDKTFVKQSLEGFTFRNVFYVPHGKHLLVRSLCMPEVKRVPDSYYAEYLREIRNFYLQNNKIRNMDHGDKLYISRKKSTKRKVVNEEEVEDVLRKYGFTSISNEDFDFNEQVAMYSHATHVISIHGAGLTNMLFMKEGSSVLELHKRRTNEYDWHSLAFWYLANALGFSYHHQVCNPDDSRATFFDANFVVDIGLLEKNVKFMLGIERSEHL